MKVKELIEKLQKYPPDMTVYVMEETGEEEITRIEEFLLGLRKKGIRLI